MKAIITVLILTLSSSFLLAQNDSPAVWKTLSKISYKKDLLCRAVGFKKQESFKLFDGTLGFGRDACHLLSFGCHVLGCEKNPVMFALINDAYQRLNLEFRERFRILHGHSGDHLAGNTTSVDCLYLDPMFEDVKKKSAPKKQMAFLREVGFEETQIPGLIKRGIELGIKRVVVKRPINGEHLYMKPKTTFSGKVVRYDVYTR